MKRESYYFSVVLFVFMALLFCSSAKANDSDLHDPAEYLSHSLPVLYINTVGNQPVVSKEEYLDATYYLDAEGFDQYESIGSVDEQLELKIKGRGNASWTKPKKPYRLKLEKKAGLLGMPKSKHWCLMAAYGDWRGKGRDYMAFQISKLMGMPWTPGNVPCELVLNGDYVGLYFIVEKIRVAKDRVNIFDQEEAADDSIPNEDVTGGWLLEIDNYNEENQVRMTDIDGSMLKVTYHSPEEVNPQQKEYITNLLNRTNNAINTSDKSSREWEEYVDIDALARFYVIQEAVDNQESFSGSCWFYKDRGDSAKFIFGPVWDFGSSMGARTTTVDGNDFLYNVDITYGNNHWIKEVVKFPRFQIALRKYWKIYRDEVYPQMQQVAIDYGNLIWQAGEADYRRWGDGSSLYVQRILLNYVKSLENKLAFLASHWDKDYVYPLGDINLDGIVDVADINLLINIMLGKDVHLYPEAQPDVNDDGIVDIADINMMINCILGVDSEDKDG